ncbi:hypothetical protein [Mucilaginibacter sp.]|uniref:hypothetical protein n=1 Tax=Mucilaginibacter sp. TaxID=1882438 RepID=UPI0035BC6F89
MDKPSLQTSFTLKALVASILVVSVPIDATFSTPIDWNKNRYSIITDYSVIDKRSKNKSSVFSLDKDPTSEKSADYQNLSSYELLESISNVVPDANENQTEILQFLSDTQNIPLDSGMNINYDKSSKLDVSGVKAVENKFIKDELSDDDIMYQFSLLSKNLKPSIKPWVNDGMDSALMSEFNQLNDDSQKEYFDNLKRRFAKLGLN